MKASVCKLRLVRRVASASALFCALAVGFDAFGSDNVDSTAPFGLSRLSANPERTNSSIKKENFESLSLAHLPLGSKGVNLESQGEKEYLEIAPDTVWEQKLRRHLNGANYVTFTINASVGTEISVSGAVMRIEASSKASTYAAVKVPAAPTFDHEVPLMPFGGVLMAPLTLVTININRRTETWDLWIRDALLAENIPLSRGEGRGASSLRVATKASEAWVCGIVCSDENPVMADANHNAVPDDFESSILGRVLRPEEPAAHRATMRAAWREALRDRPPTEFLLTTPAPDRYPEWCSPSGEVVHGMINGLKFGAPAKE